MPLERLLFPEGNLPYAYAFFAFSPYPYLPQTALYPLGLQVIANTLEKIKA